MDDLVGIATTELLRKDLYEEYKKDKFIDCVVKRNKKSWFRRNLWNLTYWIMRHRPNGVLSDMLFTAYRIGVVDERFDPFDK